jgi:hypothetical protein
MSTSAFYGTKGEGINTSGYGGYTARAPLASGGGGGSYNNSGGGGGSNYTAGGTGGGGNNCTLTNQSGGLGGVSLSTYVSGGRVFMGGGGGGGQQDGGAGSAGGRGGGIVFVGANKIATSCVFDIINITAEGASASNSGADGAGGAGAGGTVVLAVASYSTVWYCPLTVGADGGNGGSVQNFTTYGGGGGGGQGALLFTAALPTNVSSSTDNGSGGSNSYFGTSAGDGSGANNAGVIPSSIVILPLDFLSFTADRNGAANVLGWAVAQTQETVKFTVQRSADGMQFADIGNVSGLEELNYTFTDATPVAGRNFYRVQATDIDGGVKYTSVLLVNREDAMAAEIHVFPNPSHGSFTIQLADAANDNAGISIEDRAGATVYRTVATAANGRINIANIGAVAPGIYLLRVSTKDGIQTCKLILQ